jgi:hypothetical protein
MTRPRSAAFVCALALLAACSEPAAALAITNVTVVDAVSGARPAQTVVVDEGRIVAVQDASEPVDAAEVVDGTGRFLLPGLWDFHVHLTYDARFTEAMPGLFLSQGITSIRDTGGPLELVAPVVRRLRAEGAVAPRVWFAGPLMDGADVVYDGTNNPLLGVANPDVATARANVQRLADAGVDFLKIYEMVSPEVFEALVEEATARGWPIDAHVPLSLRARDVGPRLQSLEHLRNLEMDCAADAGTLVGERRRLLANPERVPGSSLRSMLHSLQRLAAVAAYDERECAQVIAAMASTIQTPTLRLNSQSLRPPWDRPDWDAELAELPPEVEADWGATTAERRASTLPADTTFAHWSVFLVDMMHDRGVPIAAGTDTPIGFAAPGYSLHSELEFLVRAGLSPLEALEAATVRPAEFFGLEGEMGRVAEGYLADLVLLSADPLADIDNSRRVEAVVTKGVLLDRGELDGLVR